MAKALDQASLYDTDYVAWLQQQVSNLRARGVCVRWMSRTSPWSSRV